MPHSWHGGQLSGRLTPHKGRASMLRGPRACVRRGARNSCVPTPRTQVTYPAQVILPPGLAHLSLGLNLGHERGHGGARQPAQRQLTVLCQQRRLELLLKQPRRVGGLQRLAAVGPRLAADVVQREVVLPLARLALQGGGGRRKGGGVQASSSGPIPAALKSLAKVMLSACDDQQGCSAGDLTAAPVLQPRPPGWPPAGPPLS